MLNDGERDSKEMTTADASATLRGFKNQSLYILSRLLTDPDSASKSFVPEGAEDLAIYDSSGALIESIQVKDFASRKLALSDFKPKSKSGFISRYFHRLKSWPTAQTKIASFGELGPELADAIKGDATQRQKVVAKLVAQNELVGEEIAIQMLDRLKEAGNIEFPNPENLTAGVTQALSETNAAGHIETTLRLLMAWIFEASEEQSSLTKKRLLEQVDGIGDYLASLRDISSEWFVSVSPIKSMVLSPDERLRLVKEYQSGIQAGWKHILAEADSVRLRRIHELRDKLREHSVTFIRGASGQGKSTLAWRYLHDYSEDGLRFEVSLVESREHAMRVANAISGHVRKLALTATVYIDVEPNNIGWERLVRELAMQGLKVLVAIREEDFRRATLDFSKFDFAEVVLDGVSMDEAEAIYDSLSKKNINEEIIDFADAWGKFTDGNEGPLLEFTHIVTQGQTLQSRIDEQVSRLRKDAAKPDGVISIKHLKLLALCAVANAADARVSYIEACEVAGLDAITNPIEVLSHEYLIPISIGSGSTFISGLHAVRSQALEAAIVPDDQWESYACDVVPLVADEDLQSCLLDMFVAHPESRESLKDNVLMLSVRSWAHASGIANALIWLGMDFYERQNRDVLNSLIQNHGESWIAFCDFYVGMNADLGEEYRKTNSLPRAELTQKRAVFDFFLDWATQVRNFMPAKLSCHADWNGAGDVAFWIGHLEVDGLVRDRLLEVLAEIDIEDISVQPVSAFVSGLSKLSSGFVDDWIVKHEELMRRKYILETESICVTNSGGVVKDFFVIRIDQTMQDAENSPIETTLHAAAMKRANLLRSLFPSKTRYATEGIGIDHLMPLMQNNPTIKSIAAESMFDDRSVNLNAAFRGIVEYRHLRPKNLKEYVSKIIEHRKLINRFMQHLRRCWSAMLNETTPSRKAIKAFPLDEAKLFYSQVRKPMYPQTVVDEWGIVSEGRGSASDDVAKEAVLQRFEPWRRAFRDYSSAMGNVINFAKDLTESRIQKNVAAEKDARRLLLVNLGEAWSKHLRVTDYFNAQFAGHAQAATIEDVEKHELLNFRKLWPLAFSTGDGPQSVSMEESEIASRMEAFLVNIRQEVSAVMAGHGTAEVRHHPWELRSEPCLTIVCNHRKLATLDKLAQPVIEAVARAASRQEWSDRQWTPLKVKWQQVAVVHEFRDKCLAPSISRISLDSIFAQREGFTAQAHNFSLQAVDREEFLAGGFLIWDTPLLKAVIDFSEAIIRFIATAGRFTPLYFVIVENNLPDILVSIGVETLEADIEIALSKAQLNYNAIADLLALQESDSTREVALELERITKIRLLSIDGSSKLELTVESYTKWFESIEETDEDFHRILLRLFELALDMA